MNEKDEIAYWKENTCVQMLTDMGIGKGAFAVDFGCGVGNYTIPLAYAVGDVGKVCAVDLNRRALAEIREQAERRGLSQIRTVCPIYENEMEFESGSVDAILIYDLIHALVRSRGNILQECHRVLLKNGLLSILPFHMSEREKTELVEEVQAFGFRLCDVVRNGGIHFEMQRFLGAVSDRLDKYEQGDIYNFRKAD